MRVLSFALLLVAGCSRGFTPPPVPRASGECVFNGDCAVPRICAGGTCRAECRTDRDCSGGTLCRPSDVAGLEVCLPPDAIALCAFSSDCSTSQGCGADHRCHLGCHADADCPGSTCDLAQGRCVGPTPVQTVGGCVVCGARCVDLTNDPAHCGTCSTACAPGGACVNGTCTFGACADSGPCNDTCTGATPVTLTGPQTSFGFNPTGYTSSVHGCAQQPDAYFRYHLDQRSFVVAAMDRSPAGPLRSGGVGLLDDCASAGSANCGDPICGVNTALASAVLPAGEHLLVTDFSGPEATQFTLAQYPLPDGTVVEPMPSASRFVLKAQSGPPPSGPGVCGGSAMVHAWAGPNPCFSGSSSILTVSTCGSSPGVVAGVLDAQGRVGECTSVPDPACDGGGAMLSIQLVRPTPLFIFGVLPVGADGGLVLLSGTFQ